MKHIIDRAALQAAQDLAQQALAATDWRRATYWRAAMGELRKAYGSANNA